jgi:curved DNA-binding protein CbpA
MPDPFALLGLEPCPRVEDADLQSAFLRKAVRLHPDTSTEPDAAERFQDIQSARAVLQDPVENLRAFLEVATRGETPPQSTVQLPPDLLDLFMRLSALRETLDSLHSRRNAALTPLARALAERELAALQPRLAPVESELESAWQHREARIQAWWNASPPRNPGPLWEILRDMKFLQKWRSQFQGTRAANPLSRP